MNGEAHASREQLRAHRLVFWEAWAKSVAGLPLNALEVRIARIISMHTEYHPLFDNKECFLERDFEVNEGANPYLHLSLHLALEEQVATHQPPEVAKTLEHFMQRKGLDRHDALHVLMEALAETVHFAQRAGHEPDVEGYRIRLKELMR